MLYVRTIYLRVMPRPIACITAGCSSDFFIRHLAWAFLVRFVNWLSGPKLSKMCFWFAHFGALIRLIVKMIRWFRMYRDSIPKNFQTSRQAMRFVIWFVAIRILVFFYVIKSFHGHDINHFNWMWKCVPHFRFPYQSTSQSVRLIDGLRCKKK